MTKLSRNLAFLTCALLPVSSGAAPVTWYLDGVEFEGGGLASGSFVYDADTGVFSNFDITTTPEGTHGGQLYGPAAGPTGFASATAIDVVADDSGSPDFNGQPALYLPLNGTPMTNAGGTIGIGSGFEGTCNVADCATVDDSRNVVAGQITTGRRWYLDEVSFATGGKARGGFLYDADRDVFSDFRIETTADGTRAAAFYGPSAVATSFSNAANIEVVAQGGGDLTGQPILTLDLDLSMVNGGGEIPMRTTVFEFSREETCLNAACNTRGNERAVSSGWITTSLRWYLDDVIFFLGAPATGSFLYSVATNTFVDFDIQTAPNDARPGDYYGEDAEVGPNSNATTVQPVADDGDGDYTDEPTLFLNLSRAMTVAGGTIVLKPDSPGSEGPCANSTCDFHWGVEARDIFSGRIKTLPEPSALPFGLAALAALALRRWRRSGGETERGAKAL